MILLPSIYVPTAVLCAEGCVRVVVWCVAVRPQATDERLTLSPFGMPLCFFFVWGDIPAPSSLPYSSTGGTMVLLPTGGEAAAVPSSPLSTRIALPGALSVVDPGARDATRDFHHEMIWLNRV